MKDKRGFEMKVGDWVVFILQRQFHSCEWSELESGKIFSINEEDDSLKITYRPLNGGAETIKRRRKEVILITQVNEKEI